MRESKMKRENWEKGKFGSRRQRTTYQQLTADRAIPQQCELSCRAGSAGTEEDQTFGLCIVPISARPRTAREHELISLSCICKRVLCQASDGFELESFEMNDSNRKQRDGLLPPSAVAVWEAGHVLRGRPKQSE